jgi:acetyltransferase-like isoleucine patch superfamily enzyme
VYWTPHIEILDRDLLTIGDGVIFGHLVKTASHVVVPRKKGLWVYIKPVIVNSHSFIGAGSVLGPGTEIPEGEFLPAKSELFRGRSVSSSSHHRLEADL